MSEIREQIEALYDFALDNPANEYRVVDIMPIEKSLSEHIFLETGVDLRDFRFSIDNYSIVHTLLRHGNPAKESKHGQIAVVKADFTRLPEILTSPDSIRLDFRTYGNSIIKESLIFYKSYEHHYVVAKEIRRVLKKGKVNRLILQTMFIRKNAETRSASLEK